VTDTASDKAVAAHLRHIRLEGKSARTAYERGLTLKRLAAALPVPLLEASEEDLYEWRAALTVKDVTVACYASGVRSFFRWCAERDLIASDPARKLPVPKSPRRLPRPISEQDLLYAVDTASATVRQWLKLAGWNGLRAKEITLLRAECIRLRDDVPTLRILYTATKGRSERTIPIHPYVAAELERADLPSSGLVFRRADGSALAAWTVSKICNQHLHAVGIADTFHSLRHRYLTKAYEVSRDLKAAQALAGHAHIQTTAGYAAIDGSALARTVNAIPSPLEREAS